ncbi:methylated-DNA--protein-cysteine methyltransferase [Gordonia sihwensis NBRC 108236]|uniref:Methylated-DNA--protein-cysteine methyltransferase n=2 Tax=Gordonia TaxID=2053 RepID=L7LK97_9ACTN|nr:cysteine methyltransferase [Gordonia sp. YC-JH1]GAC61181.1 methylated-DNA--protein-cysteine methyltransferase [Gordonia sihwensis NBRC 108236]
MVDTELGRLTMVADGSALTAVYFPHHWHLPPETEYGEPTAADDPVFVQAARELDEYVAGDRREFDVEIATSGDDFSERVWAMLREIPYGETTTYGELARRLGNPRLAQRVGQCVGRNPISVIIPCHRVIGADGSLTGYAGGLDRKRRLLEIEEPPEVSDARLF